LGNVQLIGEADQKSQIPSTKSQGTSKSQTSKGARSQGFLWLLVLGISLELGIWDLGFRRNAVRDAVLEKSAT
jgi:hypothetical protein